MKIFLGSETFNDRLCITQITDLNLVNDCDADEIVAPFCWNSIPVEHYGMVLELIFRKLKVGGTLLIGGYDIIEFSKAVLYETISPDDRNQLIKNSQNFSALHEVTAILESAHLKVERRTLNGLHYTIEAVKL